MQNLEGCACYVGKNDGPVHVRAVAGTIAHNVTDIRDDDSRLDDDDAGAVQDCWEYFDRIANLLHAEREREQQRRHDEAAAAGKDEFEDAPPVTELKEAYLPVDDIPLRTYPEFKSTTAGYLDTALFSWNKKLCHIIDWKFGAWAVEEADNNLQGIAYALGIFKKFKEVDEVIVHFFQPHLGLITDCAFHRRDVAKLYLRVQVVVARAEIGREEAKQGNFERANPLIPACNFCGNLGKCPKVAAIALKVGKKYAPPVIPDNVEPSILHSTRDCGIGMKLAGLLKTWTEAYRRQVTNRVLEGQADIPEGYKVAQSYSSRDIVDVKKFREIALRRVTQDELDSTVSVTLGKIEDIIREKTPRGSKKVAVDQFGEELLAAGAVTPGQPYSFLKAVSTTPSK